MMRYGCNLTRGGGTGKGGGSSHGYELRRVEGCEEALAGARRPPVALVVVEHLAQQRDGLLDATSVESLAWMEQELGWLDMQLADSPSDTRLWQQRANLLAEMASQYQRNNWQTELQLASY